MVTGEGSGVAAFWVMGEGLICAVFGELACVMVVSAVFCCVWTAVAGVSLSNL